MGSETITSLLCTRREGALRTRYIMMDSRGSKEEDNYIIHIITLLLYNTETSRRGR